jgi:hypothetical protein
MACVGWCARFLAFEQDGEEGVLGGGARESGETEEVACEHCIVGGLNDGK